MGATHARALAEGRVPRATLAAVSDTDPAALARFPGVPAFANAALLLDSGLLDALLIATPHYSHTPLSIAALSRGLHVLTEKPLAVHKADCLAMLAAYERRPRQAQVFAEMLNLRVEPRFLALRRKLQAGELGLVQRINWINTDWFRTDAYYRSGDWRATWRGEGGGVLLNQCPHVLDLWQWLFGMPRRVHAFCEFGRFHAIEVEDQVTAYLEYESGKSGVFVTSTAESPGTNRLEVAGELGKLVLEGDRLTFTQNASSMTEFLKSSPEPNARPKTVTEELRFAPADNGRLTLMKNFVDAILDGEALIAPASEGLASVELANAMLYSSLQRQTIDLPLDPALYANELARLVEGSRIPSSEALRLVPHVLPDA